MQSLYCIVLFCCLNVAMSYLNVVIFAGQPVGLTERLEVGSGHEIISTGSISELKDFSRSQAVTDTTRVVLSRKQHKTETLLLPTTNRKSYTAYRVAPFSMTLDDPQGHSPTAGLFKPSLVVTSRSRVWLAWSHGDGITAAAVEACLERSQRRPARVNNRPG